MSIIYGPLYSRRLGISLGIDIVPYKTCSFNCIYCHEGETTTLTCTRRRFLEPAEAFAALSKLQGIKQLRGREIDYLTFAGSGEPTLNLDLGDYIRYLKRISPLPVAVLTNSSLLWDENVRIELLNADLVVPSLDAASEEVLQKVNRPSPELSLPLILRGLRQFCGEFSGDTWLEILLCRGINDSEDELFRLAKAALELDVNRIQLHTVSRPPALHDVQPVEAATLQRFQVLLGARGDIVQDETGPAGKDLEKDLEKAILHCLGSRPANLKTLVRETKKSGQEIIKVLSRLEKEGAVQRFIHDGASCYRLVR